jgi:hypothetical protein
MDLDAVTVEFDFVDPAFAGWHLIDRDGECCSMKPG